MPSRLGVGEMTVIGHCCDRQHWSQAMPAQEIARITTHNLHAETPRGVNAGGGGGGGNIEL